MLSKPVPLGIYEKALPGGTGWPERLKLAASLGFDFVEMSIDESDERLARLSWSRQQRLALISAILESGVRVPSLCLSAHRRFPLGSVRMMPFAPGGWILCVTLSSWHRIPSFVLSSLRVTMSTTSRPTTRPGAVFAPD